MSRDIVVSIVRPGVELVYYVRRNVSVIRIRGYCPRAFPEFRSCSGFRVFGGFVIEAVLLLVAHHGVGFTGTCLAVHKDGSVDTA